MQSIKKIVFVVILVLVSVGITFLEIQAIEKKKEENYGELIIASEDISVGIPIKIEDLKSVKVLKDTISPYAFTEKENLIGKVLQVAINKDEVITYSMIAKSGPHAKAQKKNGESQTALKLPPEASLAWQMAIGDEVTVVFTSEKDSAYEKIGPVVVDGIYDHLIEENAVPTYLLVSGAPEIIDLIVKNRHLGHLEVIKP